MKTTVSDLLLDISSEKNGYSIGKPWRFTEFSLAAIVPLIRQTQEVRNYRLLSEAVGLKIKDTGNISKVELINEDEYPVLIKSGEVVSGATQSRTLTVSTIIMPKERVIVDCACVQSSNPIHFGQKMERTIYSPTEVRRAVYHGYQKRYDKRPDGSMPRPIRFGDENSINRAYHYDGSTQQGIWSSVNLFSTKSSENTQKLRRLIKSEPDRFKGFHLDEAMAFIGATYKSAANDLPARVKENEEKYKAILSKVPKVENQVGICFISVSGVESMEGFNHPDSWNAIRKAVLGSDADKILDVGEDASLFEFREDKAKEVIKSLMARSYDETEAVKRDNTSTILLEEKTFMGEVVLLHDKPIHITFLKKAS